MPQSLEIPTPSIMTAVALLPRLSNATATAVLPQLSNATFYGIPINNKATSGVTIFIELERLWNNGVVKRAADAIDNVSNILLGIIQTLLGTNKAVM